MNSKKHKYIKALLGKGLYLLYITVEHFWYVFEITLPEFEKIKNNFNKI